MATFRKRGGTWRAEVRRKGVYRSESFPTKAAAVAWAAEIEGEVVTGQRGQTANKTLGDALRRYSEFECPKRGGARWEQIRIKTFLKSMRFVGERIDEVSPDQIGHWRDTRMKQVSPGSVLRELALLSGVFETARKEWRWIRTNPCHDVTKPRKPAHRTRIISDAERDAIVEKTGWIEGAAPQGKTEEVAVVFLLALETAMRAGEILGLAPQHVALAKRYVHLPKSKNGDARDVPLTKRAVELLELVPDLFTLDAAMLDALFRKVRDKTAVNGKPIVDLTFHDARHTAITRLAQKLHVLDLARMTGHRNPKSLLIYYNETATSIAHRLD